MNIFEKQFHVLKLCFHMFNTSFTIYGLLIDSNTTYDTFEKPFHVFKLYFDMCTALVVGSDDVASSYCVGVLIRCQVGRREGGREARVVASY